MRKARVAISCGVRGEQRRLGCTRGKRGNANITGGSRKLPQLCMKRDPPPAALEDPVIFILLVDAKLWDLCSNIPLSPALTLLLRDLHAWMIHVTILASLIASFFLYVRFVVNQGALCDNVMDTYTHTVSCQQQNPSTPLPLPGAPFCHCWITLSSGHFSLSYSFLNRSMSLSLPTTATLGNFTL